MKNKLFLALLLLAALPAFVLAAGDGVYQVDSDTPYDVEVVVSQSITAEISISMSDTAVAMSAAIPGLTGGSSDGSTQFRVLTNNASGYNVALDIADASGRMVGPTINSVPHYISAFTGSGVAWSVGANLSAFGWSTTSGVWWGNDNSSIETSPYPTAADVASSTLSFKVTVTPNPSPTVAEGAYYATTTLTATML